VADPGSIADPAAERAEMRTWIACWVLLAIGALAAAPAQPL